MGPLGQHAGRKVDVVPGREAVDVSDLAGESGEGEDKWLSRAELEAG